MADLPATAAAAPLVRVVGATKRFSVSGAPPVTAVDDASLEIYRGESFGLVGQSGGGKSTLGLMVLGIVEPSAGEVWFDGVRMSKIREKERRRHRRDLQMVFQNPISALNPRRTIGESIELPLINFGMGTPARRRQRVMEVLRMVGLQSSHAERYPHEFSGGQAQRIGIARAIAVEPRFIFLDEPVSALDVSIQAQILNLLKDLQERLELTYLFVAHDISVVRFMSDRMAVMKAGRIVEIGLAADVVERPTSDYTRDLIAAVLPVATPAAAFDDAKGM
jgi:peptide/nickel transport system ATP-binding protein/oligopeptide transport system ATP-binding protein